MLLDSTYNAYLIFKDEEGHIFVSKFYNQAITTEMNGGYGMTPYVETKFEANLDWIKCLERDQVQVFDLTEDEIINILKEE